ncbi:MAG TPA: 4-alpha-glucanotransferase [Tepidisphaeraceae bacterium]|nr:4-alpha-glucanotransferase [Tepidisphaeraceae bacterium]
MIQRPTTGKKADAQGMGPLRDAGVLMHITSLPGPYGIGDLGEAAYAWVDALQRAQQRWWQILPLGPPGEGYSPYNALSAFAGNPNLISPETVRREDLLRHEEVQSAVLPAGPVNYSRVTRTKASIWSIAWERFRAGAARKLRPGFEQF